MSRDSCTGGTQLASGPSPTHLGALWEAAPLALQDVVVDCVGLLCHALRMTVYKSCEKAVFLKNKLCTQSLCPLGESVAREGIVVD